jgi:hypothetical protein
MEISKTNPLSSKLSGKKKKSTSRQEATSYQEEQVQNYIEPWRGIPVQTFKHLQFYLYIYLKFSQKHIDYPTSKQCVLRQATNFLA